MSKKDPGPATPVLMAIDVSGSMYQLADDVRGGFNQYLDTLAADTLHNYKITLTLFDTVVRVIDKGVSPATATRLTEQNYQPGGGTALLDAVGNMVAAYDQVEGERPLVVIHTDGFENSSREWSMKSLAALIEAKKASGWEFVFLGAGVDAWEGERLGMFAASTVNTRSGTRGTYEGLSYGTVAYASGASGQSVNSTAAKYNKLRDEEAGDGE